jgi:hypothetical protein
LDGRIREDELGVACSIGESAYNVLVAKLERKGQPGRLGIGGRIILKYKLKRERGRIWSGFLWFRIGPSGELL